MKITYVKIHRKKESVKDPVYHWIKEVLPNDSLNCAEVPDHIALFGDRKIEFAVCSSRPEIMIGCGDIAEVILRNTNRYCILINPSLSQDDEESLRDDKRVRILRTESPSDEIDKEFLINNLIPMFDSLRHVARTLSERINSLIELAHSQTDKTPEDFDPGCDILENLKKHKETVEISERLCPDCGHEMISFFVSSPDWTWAQLCGRAGRLTYCPMCKTQHGFWVQIMN